MPTTARASNCSDVKQLGSMLPKVLAAMSGMLRSVIGEVITHKGQFQGAGLAAGPVDSETVDAGQLGIRNNQGAGAEGLRIFATSDRGDCQGDEIATVGLPEIENIGVLNGVEGSGDGHLGQSLGTFEVVDTLANAISVVTGSSGIPDATE